MTEEHKAYLDGNAWKGTCAHCGGKVIRRIAGTTHTKTMESKYALKPSIQRCYASEAESREMEPRISGRRFASLQEVSNYAQEILEHPDVIAAFGKKACTFNLDILDTDDWTAQEAVGGTGFYSDDDHGIIELSERGMTEGVFLHELAHAMVARVFGFLSPIESAESGGHYGHFLEYELVIFSAAKGAEVAKKLAMTMVHNNAIPLEKIPGDCCFTEGEYMAFCKKWEEKMQPRLEPTWKNQTPSQTAKSLVTAIKKCVTGKKLLAVVDETERFMGMTGEEDLALTVGLHAAAQSPVVSSVQGLELSYKLSRLAFDTTSEKLEVQTKRDLLIEAATNISKVSLSGPIITGEKTAPARLVYAGQTI